MRTLRRSAGLFFLVAVGAAALSSASCKGDYCKGYRDACIKDCVKQHSADEKECPTFCDEKLKTHPGYKGCLDKK